MYHNPTPVLNPSSATNFSIVPNLNFSRRKFTTSRSLDSARAWYYHDERVDPNILNNCLAITMYGNTPTEVPLLYFPKGTPLYHWGPLESDKYLTANSGIPTEVEMNNLIRSGATFIQGGGFYVSTDIVDSSEYGPVLGVLRPQTDLFFVNYDELRGAFGYQSWNDLNIKIKLREAGVAGTYATTATAMPLTGSKRGLWLTITDHTATRGYRTARPDDVFFEKTRPNSTLKNHVRKTFSIMGQIFNF